MLLKRLFLHFKKSRRDRLSAYFILAILALAIYEWRTSVVESWIFSHYAKKLQFKVGPGPSPNIIFPKAGPADKRLGYVNIPAFTKKLQEHDYNIARQVRFSPELLKAVQDGISPPYEEKTIAGLTILDRSGKHLYESVPREKVFPRFDDVPEDIIKILLFIENRELLNPSDEHQNPVIEWDRMAKAGIKYVGKKIGLPVSVEGGSTLATQIEKYQHSEGGRTNSAKEKIRQITSASLKVYRAGRDTTVSRRDIVTDYINTVPLSAVAGYGEVYGLGEGLWAWFGSDIKEVSGSLKNSVDIRLRAESFKKVMALLLAVKAPSYYLSKDKTALLRRVEQFTDLMLKEGEITHQFHAALKAAPLRFRTSRIDLPQPNFTERKASNIIRYQLLNVLDLPGSYDLDRLDLTVNSTLDADIQNKVTAILQQLTDTEFVKSSGLMQERMLESGDPKNLIYSFVLYEKTPAGNTLRVQADNLNKPLDINEGVKLDLGSTAKLRTLAHYLQIIAESYEQMSGQSPDALKDNPSFHKDPITRWLAELLITNRGISLKDTLELSMERTFSGNPAEVFFTGGGEHRFQNFKKADNRIMTLYDGLKNSVNLVFVRLMQEIVYYHMARLNIDAKAILDDPDHPQRKELLEQIADKESSVFLSKFFNKYRRLSLDKVATKLSRHPLELWTIDYLNAHPDAKWNEILQASTEIRKEASEWLFHTRNRHARELRLRILFEEMAFREIHKGWKKLGYPFDHLVPSYATSIGSSADRPAALAELMGIIVNDGVRMPSIKMPSLNFAKNTPYETEFHLKPVKGERVMPAEVAQVLKKALAGVVESGTARRAYGALTLPDGTPVVIGGKTGSGDNRFETFAKGGRLISSHVVNRTATFVFYIGDSYFGVLTAFMPGEQAADYSFTSALPVQILRLLMPSLKPMIVPEA